MKSKHFDSLLIVAASYLITNEQSLIDGQEYQCLYIDLANWMYFNYNISVYCHFKFWKYTEDEAFYKHLCDPMMDVDPASGKSLFVSCFFVAT